MAEETASDPLASMDENVKGALTYLLGWITGLIFLLTEKKSKFVKFHALQSVITFLSLHILTIIIGSFMIPAYRLWTILQLMYILIFILWVVLMVKAYQGEKFKIPLLGDIAENQVYK